MSDHPGFYQKMYPKLRTTQSADMPHAPPPSPAPHGRTINMASTDGPNEIVTTGITAACCKDQQNSLEPTTPSLCELSKNLTQADHNLLYVIHHSVYDTQKATVEQLATIDMHTNVSRSTQELSEQVDALNRAYGFKQRPYQEGIVGDEDVVLENMVRYFQMLEASGTAREQRALIDSALYSPTVRSGDESHLI